LIADLTVAPTCLDRLLSEMHKYVNY